MSPRLEEPWHLGEPDSFSTLSSPSLPRVRGDLVSALAGQARRGRARTVGWLSVEDPPKAELGGLEGDVDRRPSPPWPNRLSPSWDVECIVEPRPDVPPPDVPPTTLSMAARGPPRNHVLLSTPHGEALVEVLASAPVTARHLSIKFSVPRA